MVRPAMSPATRVEPARAPQRPVDEIRATWLQAFRRVRAETEARAAHLSAEDQIVQSMEDASPAKWHRAHVTWFFEQFLLVPHDPTYRIFDERFPFLFNSYYVAAGPRHARPQRGLITRPNGEDVSAYRAHVDAAVERLIAQIPAVEAERVLAIVEIGLHHEQQHQELLITDILHAFAQNPTDPVYDANWQPPRATQGPRGYVEVTAGIHAIGHEAGGFCFDNETPFHDELIPHVRIARHLITNGEWLEFIDAAGYTTPSLWLSDGWTTVQTEGWQAPGHWRKRSDAWHVMTLGGLRPVDHAAPAAFVLDDHCAQHRLHLVRPQPRGDVGRATRGERNDQADRTVRIGERGNGQRGGRCGGKSVFEDLAAAEQVHGHGVPSCGKASSDLPPTKGARRRG